MMMYRMALYFAIVSALVGAVGQVMTFNDQNAPGNWWYDENGTLHVTYGDKWYNDNNSKTHWFSGSNIHPIDNNSIFTDYQIEAMQNQNVISEDASTDAGSYSFGALSVLHIAWSMGKGVLLIADELDKVLRVDDGKGHNAFAPFIWMIQLGIWAIYAIGIAQVLRNANYRYNY